MTFLADYAILSHGWRRTALLILAGAIAGLSAAPLFIVPALFIGLTILVWTLDGAERAKPGLGTLFSPAFFIGLWFGLGYFLVSTHWVGAAFFVDGGPLLFAMPLAVLALSTVLALFWGAGVALAHWLWSAGWMRIFALAFGLALAEFARGHLFTGFPFSLVGYALTANEQMMQATSLVGVYGLTVVAIAIAATPALVWPAAERPLVSRLLPLFMALGIVALQLGWGQARLNGVPIERNEEMVMRLVQPVVPQDIKWQTSARQDIVSRLIDLSEMRSHPEDAGLDDVTHLVWPEAALPFYLSEEPQYLARIARMLPDDTMLLTGAPRLPFEGDSSTKPYNSILAIDSAGEVISSYDKTHLVPFGEYLPFQDQLGAIGFSQFVHGSDGWAAGEARRLMELPGSAPFLPLICYEAIYPGRLGPIDDAHFILVVTNDAWFDGSIGPAQHFHHHRVRAVEEGKSMVRSANSGISAIIDPLGRLDAHIAHGAVGTIKGSPALALETTVYAQWREGPFLVLAGLALLVAALGRIGKRGVRR